MLDNDKFNFPISPYDWGYEENNDGKMSIYSWGLTQENESVLVRIEDFPVSCVVDLSCETIRMTKDIYEKCSQKMKSFDNGPSKVKIVKFKPLYGYQENEKMYIYCMFDTISQMYSFTKFKHMYIKYFGQSLKVHMYPCDNKIGLIRKFITYVTTCSKIEYKFSQWFQFYNGVECLEENEKLSTCKYEFKIKFKNFCPISIEESSKWEINPKIFSFDIEAQSFKRYCFPNAHYPKDHTYMISCVVQRTGLPEERQRFLIKTYNRELNTVEQKKFYDFEVICAEDEIEMYYLLAELINTCDPEIVTGYHIFGFDWPFMTTRLERLLLNWPNMSRWKEFETKIIKPSWSSSAYGAIKLNYPSTPGRIQFDMHQYVKREMKFKMYDLGTVSKQILGRGKHDVSPDQMWLIYDMLQKSTEMLNRCVVKDENGFHFDENISNNVIKTVILNYQKAIDEISKVEQYCVEDSELVIDLFEKMNVWICLMESSNIMGVTPSTLYTRGQQIRGLSMIYDYAFRKGYIICENKYICQNPKLKGAIVLVPIIGIHPFVMVNDFNSLYPSIMIELNICYTTYTEDESIPDEMCNICEWDDAVEIDGVETIVHRRYRFIKREHKRGILPQIAEYLISERTKVKHQMKNYEKGSVMYNILDARQLSLKISVNSLYGLLGVMKNGKLPFLQGAMCVTWRGRSLITGVSEYSDRELGTTTIYGDSVTGETPTIIKRGDNVELVTIEHLFNIANDMNVQNDEKQYRNFENVDVWTEKGWTSIHNIMRHKTNKKIYRVLTHTGYVEVTEDHSLLCENGEEVTPNNVQVGDLLMSSYPTNLNFGQNDTIDNVNLAYTLGLFVTDGSCGTYSYKKGERVCKRYTWAINNKDIELLNSVKDSIEEIFSELYDCGLKIIDTLKSSGVYKLIATKNPKIVTKLWRKMCYGHNKEKIIPTCILSSNLRIKQYFYDGLYAGDGDKTSSNEVSQRIDTKNQLSAASYYMFFKSMGYNVSINTRKDKENIFRLTLTKSKQREISNKIKKIEELKKKDEVYVYDLTTENHHFHAGVGDLIVHNTDSTMYIHPDAKTGKDCIEYANYYADETKCLFGDPLRLEFEKGGIMIINKKKDYSIWQFNRDGNLPLNENGYPANVLHHGTLARRADTEWFHDLYLEFINTLLLGQAFKNIYNEKQMLENEKFVQNVQYLMEDYYDLEKGKINQKDFEEIISGKVFQRIIDVVIKHYWLLVNGKVSNDKLFYITQYSGKYKKTSNAFMKTFAKKLHNEGKILEPGDRVKYVIIENGNSKKGEKCCLWESFDPNKDHLDYVNYIESQAETKIDLLINTMFPKQVQKLEKYYSECIMNKLLSEFELTTIKELDNLMKMKTTTQKYMYLFYDREQIRTKNVKLKTKYVTGGNTNHYCYFPLNINKRTKNTIDVRKSASLFKFKFTKGCVKYIKKKNFDKIIDTFGSDELKTKLENM